MKKNFRQTKNIFQTIQKLDTQDRIKAGKKSGSEGSQEYDGGTLDLNTGDATLEQIKQGLKRKCTQDNGVVNPYKAFNFLNKI